MSKRPIDLDLLSVVPPVVLVAAHATRRRHEHVVASLAINVSVVAVLGDGIGRQVNDVCVADVAYSTLCSGVEAA